MNVHRLKTWPEAFDALRSGGKTFEFRWDDRGFAVGDLLELERFDPQRGATGERMTVEVTYTLRGAFGVPRGYVCMSVRPVWPRPRSVPAARCTTLRIPLHGGKCAYVHLHYDPQGKIDIMDTPIESVAPVAPVEPVEPPAALELPEPEQAAQEFAASAVQADPAAVPPTAPAWPDPLLQFFEYGHLPPALQHVSARFAELAHHVAKLPRNPERTVALRKLLEGKDCAVRAVLYRH